MLKTMDPESSGEDVEGQIARCLAAAEDVAALRQEVGGLSSLPGKRAEFAFCLFSLDLARLGEAEAKAQFARHAGVLLEAHRNPDVAAALLGGNEGLERRWERFVPLLAEFDRALGGEPALSPDRTLVDPHPGRAMAAEHAAAAASEGPTHDGAPDDAIDGVAEAAFAARDNPERLKEVLQGFGALPRSDRVDFALCLFNLERVRRGEEDAKADFAVRTSALLLAYRDPAEADVLIGQSAGLRTLWTELVPYLEEFFEPPEDDEGLEIMEVEDAAVPAEVVSEALDAITAPGSDAVPPPTPRRPPPPPSLTPVPNQLALPTARKPNISHRRLVVPPPPPPEPSLLPSPETAAFWAHAEKELSLLPDENGQLSGKQAFSVATRDERSHLKTFAGEVVTRFPHSPEARSMGALVELLLAAHLKEKTLFGKPNDKRLRAARDALSLLTADPLAAGHAAVLFENDGPETIANFADALSIVHRFLGHCLRQKVDPLSPEAVSSFEG